MPPTSPVQRETSRYSGKQGVGALCFWLLASTLVGFLAAMLSGEHGSVVFIGLGFSVGIAGALSHNILLAATKYRSFSGPRKALTLWSGTMLALVALAAVAASNWDQPYSSALKDAVALVLLYCAVPALLGAPIAVHLVESAA